MATDREQPDQDRIDERRTERSAGNAEERERVRDRGASTEHEAAGHTEDASPRIGPPGTTQVDEGLSEPSDHRDLEAALRSEPEGGAPTEDSPARGPTERLERLQAESREGGRAEVEERQVRKVRDDAESRRDLEAPRSPDQSEDELRASPPREEVEERRRRDREELGRPSMESHSRQVQEAATERREREADENELRR